MTSLMYININMLEPTTASIAIYLLTKGTLKINKHKRLIQKNPFHIKKKVCKWMLKNKDELMNSFIDETNDMMINTLNIFHIQYLNPKFFMILYIILLIMIIIF